MKYLLPLCFFLSLFSCEFENIDYLTPIMITDEPSGVQFNSAKLGGRVLGEGGLPVTEYGIVLSTEFPPTINDIKYIEGERIGRFSKRYTDLEPGTTYFISAYGINGQGAGYGEVFEIMTQDRAPCTPTINNRINFGNFSIDFSGVSLEEDPTLSDGNIGFRASAPNSIRLYLAFNEIDGGLPLNGTYSATNGFNIGDERSIGLVEIAVTDFGFGSISGGGAPQGEKVYLERTDSQITFIFCDTEVGEYIFNGKLVYNIR